MKTWVKVFIGILAFFLFIGFLRNQFPKDENSSSHKLEKRIPFDSLSLDARKSLVYDFINGQDSTKTRFKINEVIKDALSKSVKYPETIEYFYNNEWVDGTETYIFNPSDCKVDSEKFNRIYVNVDFRSENSFGQKVRNKFELVFDFYGYEPYKIVDAKILE